MWQVRHGRRRAACFGNQRQPDRAGRPRVHADHDLIAAPEQQAAATTEPVILRVVLAGHPHVRGFGVFHKQTLGSMEREAGDFARDEGEHCRCEQGFHDGFLRVPGAR
ncbi:hypothetical protein D3C85_1080340 [compost metagenome]